MADHYINMPLFEDNFYTYNISLEGNSYILEFCYNSRSKLYFFSLYDDANNPLVLGEALVPNYPILKDYALINLSGFFWMQEKSDILSEPYKSYPENIDQYYDLYYLYSD